MIISVLRVMAKLIALMNEQKREQTRLMAAMDEQKQEQATQIETLKRTFIREMEALKADVERLTEKVETHPFNAQSLLNASPSYADVARTPPSSQPSNLQTLSTYTTPSAMTDTLLHG
ncbi:hypothetical protein K469DRAFT_687753 [Zopfia rhizophila CBS 207.26]|uniref:Uncharacterized protein n=1 Tax=Zopfia rhizophila CBS 207.26 TaxID=1314779 RepID=A0A6A6E202_9PEZI|nr:hypothetical protein K469DRAFT_687753 [Zopfia rhizophila CBS 207.26]